MTWEQRWHPLREEWVIVAAHRNDRPWIGEEVGVEEPSLPAHDPSCALCPGNERVSGHRNEDYAGIFVFDNDHPCVDPEAPEDLAPAPGIYQARPARGLSRVLCYHPRHDRTLAELPVAHVRALLEAWRDQTTDLGQRPDVDHVLVFENKGEVVGVSNPHPHCQIYATNFVFPTIQHEARVSSRHWREHGRSLMEDVIRSEQEDGRRILAERDSAIAFLPWFARYAYETFVTPKARHACLATFSVQEMDDLAQVLHETLVRFDNLWQLSFPYIMTLHQAPTDGSTHDGFHFHVEFQPPLRKPGLRKYLAGPEVGGGGFLSDTSPEEKAAELQATSLVHYRQQESGP